MLLCRLLGESEFDLDQRTNEMQVGSALVFNRSKMQCALDRLFTGKTKNGSGISRLNSLNAFTEQVYLIEQRFHPACSSLQTGLSNGWKVLQ